MDVERNHIFFVFLQHIHRVGIGKWNIKIIKQIPPQSLPPLLVAFQKKKIKQKIKQSTFKIILVKCGSFNNQMPDLEKFFHESLIGPKNFI